MVNLIKTDLDAQWHSEIRRLKPGQNYTLVSFSSTGNPYQMQFTLKSMRCDEYGMHTEAYFIQYKKPYNKVLYTIWMHSGKQFLIWEDHINPDTRLECGSYIKEDGTKIIRRWPAWDARYIHRAKESVLYDPIVSLMRPIEGPERVLNLCSIIG